MRRGLTIGTFDPVHVDHVLLFRRALEHCEELLVGVNSDAFVGTYRGESPLFDQDERMEMVRALGHGVRLNDGPGRDLIEELSPHVLVVGGDWLGRDYLAQIDTPAEVFDRREITLVFVPYGPHITSSELKRRARR